MSVVCPNCFELNPEGQTRCECGRALPVSRVEPNPVRETPRGCTCGGRGICTACVLAEYDNPKKDTL